MKQVATHTLANGTKIAVFRSTYESPTGPLAIQLIDVEEGEPYATLSVNMYKPECSQDSKDLPPNCFYVKDWSENTGIANEMRTSGLFKERPDLPMAASGFVMAEAWELLTP